MNSAKDDQSRFAPFDGTQSMFRHLEGRLTAVEVAISAIETDRAVNEEKRKFMEARFNHLDDRLNKIDGHINRLVWLIVAAILGGFMSFVLNGNLLHG